MSFSFHPDDHIKCLLIHTRFSEFSYWNYRISCEAMGAKSPSAPLGLITVAAILPQHWQFRLLDLNARDFDEKDWAWADIICIGGMLPQQQGMLKIIERANMENKFIAVGGADPSSQPELYQNADALIIGEGEVVIPKWLDSWREGNPRGRFDAKEKPDVTQSPIPRFDLLRFKDYLQIGVQYSRGCPFNCEFCDIIELFGRVPRTKSSEQFLAELDHLYNLGYRGSVEFVDDNFIGNKRIVKRQLLPALIEWQRKKRYPFFFHTEASMNLADDKKLLRQMRAAQFRFIFMGIESADPAILKQTQKNQNVMGDIATRIQTLHEYGLVILGGFILGFDSEKPGTDESMIRLIEQSNIAVAMVGLLVALPNTQLTRRLRNEGRLTDLQGRRIDKEITATGGDTRGAIVEVVDQTTAGLNFVTKRNRVEILNEYKRVVTTVYDPKIYSDRAIRQARITNVKSNFFPGPAEAIRQLTAFYRMAKWFTQRPTSRKYFWKVVLNCLPMGLHRFEIAMKLMGIYLHLENQTKFVLENIDQQIEYGKSIHDEYVKFMLEQEMKSAAATATKIAELNPLPA